MSPRSRRLTFGYSLIQICIGVVSTKQAMCFGRGSNSETLFRQQLLVQLSRQGNLKLCQILKLRDVATLCYVIARSDVQSWLEKGILERLKVFKQLGHSRLNSLSLLVLPLQVQTQRFRQKTKRLIVRSFQSLQTRLKSD